VLFENIAWFQDLFLGRNVGGFAGDMQMFKNLAVEAEKRIISAITWSREADVNLAIDSPARRGYDEDATAHVGPFINGVDDEENCFSFRIELYSNTTGDDNTAIGLEALHSNTTGTSNAVSGSQASRSVNPRAAASR
jgi:hypothetical protein